MNPAVMALSSNEKAGNQATEWQQRLEDRKLGSLSSVGTQRAN
jgi:hypothetical protein